jgi:hypothetical protein
VAVALFGVASEGHASQWDGTATPSGVLLRWILDGDTRPPPHGFELFTSAVPLAAEERFGPAKGRHTWQRGPLTVASEQPLAVSGQALAVQAHANVVVHFSQPVSVVVVHSGGGPGTLHVSASHRGRAPQQHALAPDSTVRFQARAIDTLVLRGAGSLRRLAWGPSGGFKWQQIASLGLPVAHPAHPWRPAGTGEEDRQLAQQRLPESADWAGHYAQVFDELHPALRDLFATPAPPFPAEAPDGDESPRLEYDRWSAIRLACLDPNVARMLGFAFDYAPHGFPRDADLAFRVIGTWSDGPAPLTHEDVIGSLWLQEESLPPPPGGLVAEVSQPGRQPRAGLRWTPPPPGSAGPFNAIPRFQAYGRKDADDPNAVPAVGEPGPGDELTDTPVLVPPGVVGAEPPRPFVHQRELAEGVHTWWARSVDLFGRVGDSTATRGLVVDRALPPPPRIVDAAWLQAGAPPTAPWTPAAAHWRSTHPGANGLHLRWAWTPELHARAPDVEAFRVIVRRPVDRGGEDDWEAAIWQAPVLDTGAVPVTLGIAMSDVDTGAVPVDIRAVADLGDATLLTVDLALEDGARALAGADIEGAGGFRGTVVAASLGAPALLRVATVAGAPTTGAATIRGPRLATAAIMPAPLPATPDPMQTAGLITAGNARLARLGTSGDGRVVTIVLEGTAAPGGGTWYPAYDVVVDDAGFGPRPDHDRPAASLQVSVRAVRPPDLLGAPRVGPPATPATVVAVDTAPPPTAQPDPIPGGERCAQVATPADYHGDSRVSLSWSTDPSTRYVVHRALWASLVRADRAAHGAGRRVDVPDADLPDDPIAAGHARDQLDALRAALDAGTGVADAYADLRLDARQALASQPHLRRAYAPLHGEPVPASAVPYVDTFDGAAGGHWLYRIEPVSPAGVRGAWSAATPPICAPDVTAPSPPQVQLALAASGAVRLRWVRSAAGDLDHYILYRSADPSLTDARDLEQVTVLTPGPEVPASAGTVAPDAVAGHAAWLEHTVAAPPARPLTYRLVAVDRAGNASATSAPLRARALAEPPAAPTWDPPARAGDEVQLSWSATEDRLACLVERRSTAGGRWTTVTGWLPRGQYAATDRPPEPEGAWEYRLRVSAPSGLPAAVRPTVTLAEVD